jgi:steroid 5-alpha reductase family enzyme
MMAILLAAGVDGSAGRRLLVAGLAVAWAGRLCAYLLADRIVGRPEDARYRKLREHWGARAERNFLITFLAQAVLIVLFALPLWVVMKHPASFPAGWDIAGAALWLIAVAGEIAADRQLAAFRARTEHRGRTCRQGLWRYSRHPNYFFEWLHWWAYVVMAIGAPRAGLTLLGPALMAIFLFKVTGIPYTEKQALASRGEDYREYQRTTSMFIPWIPRARGESKS